MASIMFRSMLRPLRAARTLAYSPAACAAKGSGSEVTHTGQVSGVHASLLNSWISFQDATLPTATVDGVHFRRR